MKYGMYSNIESFCCIRYLLFQQHINIILIHTSVYVVFDSSSLPPVFSRFNYAAAFTCTVHSIARSISMSIELVLPKTIAASVYPSFIISSSSVPDNFTFYSHQFAFFLLCLPFLLHVYLLIGIFILMVTMVLNSVLLTIS